MSEIQRYAMIPSVALIRHPEGDVTLFADHQRILAEKDSEIVQLSKALGDLALIARDKEAERDELRATNVLLRRGPCCKEPNYCEGDCTCEICAPELAIEELKLLLKDSRDEVDELRATVERLLINSHKWTGKQMGGSPANEDSYEWVRFCDYCGNEDICEEGIPACEVTRDTLAAELKELQAENMRLKALVSDEDVKELWEQYAQPFVSHGETGLIDQRGFTVALKEFVASRSVPQEGQPASNKEGTE